jgi:hypothetical protein
VDRSGVRGCAGIIRWIILYCSLGHSFVGVVRWVIFFVSCGSFVRSFFLGSARGSHSLDNFVGVVWASFCPLLVVCGLFVRDSK